MPFHQISLFSFMFFSFTLWVVFNWGVFICSSANSLCPLSGPHSYYLVNELAFNSTRYLEKSITPSSLNTRTKMDWFKWKWKISSESFWKKWRKWNRKWKVFAWPVVEKVSAKSTDMASWEKQIEIGNDLPWKSMKTASLWRFHPQTIELIALTWKIPLGTPFRNRFIHPRFIVCQNYVSLKWKSHWYLKLHKQLH